MKSSTTAFNVHPKVNNSLHLLIKYYFVLYKFLNLSFVITKANVNFCFGSCSVCSVLLNSTHCLYREKKCNDIANVVRNALTCTYKQRSD